MRISHIKFSNGCPFLYSFYDQYVDDVLFLIKYIEKNIFSIKTMILAINKAIASAYYTVSYPITNLL